MLTMPNYNSFCPPEDLVILLDEYRRAGGPKPGAEIGLARKMYIGETEADALRYRDEFEIKPSEFNRLVASFDGFWRGAISGFGRHMVVEGQPDLDEFLKNAVMV